MGKITSIAFLVIFAAGAAAQPHKVARVTKSDSSSYASTTYKQSTPEQLPINDHTGNLSFEVKIVPGTSKKFSLEMVSPQSGYAEITLLNSRGDEVLVLHKGKIRRGLNTFSLDSAKIRPGLYYVVMKYDGGLQVADKITLMK